VLRRLALLFLFLVGVLACGRRAPMATSGPSAASGSPLPGGLHGRPCGHVGGGGPTTHEPEGGALVCAQYASARDAFADVLALDPVALGVGEAHAPKGATVPSAAKRFTTDLLPSLAGRASDLLVELMIPPNGCARAAAEAKRAQEPITTRQAETDQNEYVAMGDRARALGIVPDMLRPTCEDMDRVRDAGEDVVGTSLELIARLTGEQGRKLLRRDLESDADRGKIVVIYGGLLHNDLAPPPERAQWSYAVALDAELHGRFVALDLVVPEFVTADASWQSLPWYASYDRPAMGSMATLFRTGERSFVLIFPETRP
jgi:hypothetical protein